MLYVELYTGNLFSVCDAPSGKGRNSTVFSEYKTVSLSLLKTILTDKKEQLSSVSPHHIFSLSLSLS